MITTVRSAGVYVRDQDRARDFFTDTLGFELVQDTPMGDDGSRWIEVAPPSNNTLLVLFTPQGQEDRAGTFSNLIFHCDDVMATFDDLVAKGVEFVDEPRKELWGWWASFKDPDGNVYGLGQSGD